MVGARTVRRLLLLVRDTGQAGGSAKLAIERVAIDIGDAVMADNAGVQPVDRVIDAEGQAAYWSTLPIESTRPRRGERSNVRRP